MPNSKDLAGNIDELDKNLAQVKMNYSSVQEHEVVLQSLADKMSLLVSSDDDLMKRYQDNLSAFETYDPAIYEFFKSYEPKKYIVDATDGFVNAIDVETGNYFYDYPSYLLAKAQFEKFQKSPSTKKFTFTPGCENEANFIHVDFLNEMVALLPKKSSAGPKPIKPLAKHLSSLLLFGVGAGYHIEMFAQQHTASCVYIIEPDLDLFYLSLFSINWSQILTTFDDKGTRVFISLGEQKDHFFDDVILKSAISGRYQMAHVTGYIHYKSTQISEILAEFNRRYLEMGRGWGFFDDAVMSIGHMLGSLQQKVPLLKKDAIRNNNVADIPVFIVGNGPSLDGLIDTLKANQDKAIIISCGSALSALYEYGIIPDFHAEQERTFPVAEKIQHSCPADFLDSLVLIGPNTVHPAVFSLFKRSMMAAKANEPASALLLNNAENKSLFTNHHFINPTVANTALVMGYNLGFKNFYLFGIDLGQKKGGPHHSIKSLYYGEDEQDSDLYSFDEAEAVEVDGNFGGSFVCDAFFYQSNANLSHQIIGFDDLQCYNLNDGAKIIGSKPMVAQELSTLFEGYPQIEKEKLVDHLYSNSIHHDVDARLYKSLVNDLDYHNFSSVSKTLIDLLDAPINSFQDAVDLLFNNTIELRSTTEHIHDLLIGTVMHFQVTLTQLLYDADDEKTGLKSFKEALIYYRKFLEKAPVYYEENAEELHSIKDCKWIQKLKSKSNF